jgi:hypothetical protein
VQPLSARALGSISDFKSTFITHLGAGVTCNSGNRWVGRQIHPLLVAAPIIGAGIGDFLVQNDINFVDRRGNCYLNLGNPRFWRNVAIGAGVGEPLRIDLMGTFEARRPSRTLSMRPSTFQRNCVPYRTVPAP